MMRLSTIEGALKAVVENSPYAYFKDCVQTRLSNQFYNKVMETFEIDFQKYFPEMAPNAESIFFTPPLAGILLYRISRQFYLEQNEKQATHYSALVRFLSQMEIYYTADLGYGLWIQHGLGIVIGADCRVGNHAMIFQGATIGDLNPLNPIRLKRPVIGDNLVMFSNSKILGPVTIGNNVIISQNAICSQSLEGNQILMASGTIKENTNENLP